MILKSYQSEALDYFETFLQRCKDSGDVCAAYTQTTAEWRVPLTFRPLPTVKQVPYVCMRIPTGGGKTMIGGMRLNGSTAPSSTRTRALPSGWSLPTRSGNRP